MSANAATRRTTARIRAHADARKKQPHPDADGGEELRNLCDMKKWAEKQPPAFREGAMSIYLVKAAAYKTPVTITPKRKRKEVANDTMDREDDQEDGESGGSQSDPDYDETSRRTKRG